MIFLILVTTLTDSDISYCIFILYSEDNPSPKKQVASIPLILFSLVPLFTLPLMLVFYDLVDEYYNAYLFLCYGYVVKKCLP